MKTGLWEDLAGKVGWAVPSRHVSRKKFELTVEPKFINYPMTKASLFMCIVGTTSSVFAFTENSGPLVYLEKNGIVSIEAEYSTDNVGPWEEVEGRNAMANNHGVSPDSRIVVPVSAAGHPLAAGFTGEINLPANTFVSWGLPGDSAIVAIVAGHEPRKAVVYAYEKGALLPDGRRAPHRRVFSPMPVVGALQLGQLASAAISWASDVQTGFKRALLLTNQAALLPEETMVEQLLVSLGFEVMTMPAIDSRDQDVMDGAILVIPASVRAEKLEHKFTNLSHAIVLLNKRESARDLGLIRRPIPPRSG